jgi:ketosteroid isomerase-like protein
MMDDLKSASDEWNAAWLNKDVTAVERIAADDYLYISPQGDMLDRSDILGIIRSPTYSLQKGKWTEVSISQLGPDSALLLHRFQGEGEYRGTSFVEDNRLTTIWVRIGAQWKVRHEHCSSIAPNSTSP